MRSARIIQIVCLLLAAAVLAGAMNIQDRLDARQASMDIALGMGSSAEYPELKLLQALPGGVRAVLIDYLWIRSEKLKEKGKIFDAVQLADLICTLEARFPGVWAYQSWNLAYNISIETHTPAERWYWVRAGIELLRDKGIKYNPKSLDLYRELAWIYFHKVGERADEMHMYYKRYLAAEYQRVLGAPPRLGGMDAYKAWLWPVLDAPDPQEELLKDADAAAFVAELPEAKLALDLGLLDAYNTWSDDAAVKLVGQVAPTPAGDSQKLLRSLMSDEKWAAGRAKAVAFTRRRVLVQTYKLKPDWMRQMVDYYGPLDWRLASTHCLYWATYGLDHIKGLSMAQLFRLEEVPTDNAPVVPVLNAHRNVMNCLKQMVFFGQIVLTVNPANPDLPDLMEQPDWRFIEVTHREHIARKEHLLGIKDDRTYSAFIPAHVNFLADAIMGLYLGGHREEAQKYFTYVHDTYKKYDIEWNMNLHDYVWRQVSREGHATRQMVTMLSMSLIENAFRQGLMGYRDEMTLAMDTARQFRDEYDAKANERNKMNPFPQMQAEVAYVMMAALPASVGMELYDMLPVDVQQALYDPLSTYMPQRCRQEKLDFAKAFPEPEGRDGFRKRREAWIEQNSAPRRKMAEEQQKKDE
jgi:hypothetical protein